ncbi:MAG: hypothetical protein DHS20C19_10400 [Acidimicrobiales bacterium]|nr:MAG: hypothetical protein DHS20C19_10400 [Acidimicrobiales bacterium]
MATTTRTRVRSRLAVGTLIIFAVLGSLTTTASARWIRGASDVTTYGDDVSVCADEIALGFELVHQSDSFDSFYPSFGFAIGEEYPGTSPQLLPIYGTAQDAIDRTNELLTFEIPILYAGPSGGGYQFLGEATLPTPSGYGDGDVLYAYSFDFNELEAVAIPLTIGDSAYGCPTENPPEEIAFDVFTLWDLVRVDSSQPAIVVFAAWDVDIDSVTVGVDDGTGVPIEHLFSFWGIGVALVDLDAAGLACDSESLTLSGERPDGTAVTGDTNINPFGSSC